MEEKVILQEILNAFNEHSKQINEKMDKRFDEVNERFKEVDKRFDEINQRFRRMDNRFNEVNEKIDNLTKKVDGIQINLQET